MGARVTDGRPGALLEQRLRTAIAVAAPDSTFVVSGKNESGAMRDFLNQHGIDNVVEEPHATSTNENLENAHRLFPQAPYLLVVTSNFHALRTRLWAWHLNIPVKVIPAPTPPGYRLRNYVREVAATPHSVVRIAYRKAVSVWEKLILQT